MKILAIETSCDETAVAVVEAEGPETDARFRILGNALLSQIELHKAYGGVFPALAKREHAKNLVPILEAALEEAELLHEDAQALPEEMREAVVALLAREPGLEEQFLAFVGECEPPAIDAIAVTAGPGLEPALWVGINFAKALGLVWDKPLIAVNHMEGHVFAGLARRDGDALIIRDVALPVLALLISGGHTELVLMKEWLAYELIGATRDDAVGEAFDKVARMLDLPYPGGPEVSRLAEAARASGEANPFTLPRPMLDSPSCDFSFAGLKTAVLYLLKGQPEMTDAKKKHVAHEFEDAVADVLLKKASRALDETGARTLVIGGGVSANAHIRRVFEANVKRRAGVILRIPAADLTTDNAVMIALAGYYRALRQDYAAAITASGNRSLA
ncbi:MAG TPA: tRNA (adenosine(37)-N6)-threonylcarbamoyltransferase complex transferase subunit TsaD [Candidatus Paceibacterota bacterium]|nr:tRNA (adenosine(37)-N6)-threonylcarbamoyltransferase complex transferase subunit TsaD [Candidatus Paceibacterota bacterium]